MLIKYLAMTFTTETGEKAMIAMSILRTYSTMLTSFAIMILGLYFETVHF